MIRYPFPQFTLPAFSLDSTLLIGLSSSKEVLTVRFYFRPFILLYDPIVAAEQTSHWSSEIAATRLFYDPNQS